MAAALAGSRRARESFDIERGPGAPQNMIVYGIPVPNSSGRGKFRVSDAQLLRRVLKISGALAIMVIIMESLNIIYRRTVEETSLDSVLGNFFLQVLAGLAIPACGWFGAKTRDRNMLFSFCSCNFFCACSNAMTFFVTMTLHIRAMEACDRCSSANYDDSGPNSTLVRRTCTMKTANNRNELDIDCDYVHSALPYSVFFFAFVNILVSFLAGVWSNELRQRPFVVCRINDLPASPAITVARHQPEATASFQSPPVAIPVNQAGQAPILNAIPIQQSFYNGGSNRQVV